MLRKLRTIKGEDAVEVWANILVPATNIAVNIDTKENKSTDIKFCADLLKNNKSDVIDILSALSDDPNYRENVNAASILTDLVDLMKDEEMRGFFGLRVQTATSSAAASTNIKETH